MERHRLPPLPLAEWEDSRLYLQLVCQIIGKTRLKLHPPMNHWWHATLYLSARGITTGAIPIEGDELDIELDLCSHKVVLRRRDRIEEIALYGQPICDFYHSFRAALREMDVDVPIVARPYFCKSTIPFRTDTEHSTYDADAVHLAWVALSQVEGVMKEFRSGFIGKCSPVHLFWHSFDLACTRFSGRAAPAMEGVDAITIEAYSHEVISVGFWFGDDVTPEAAFYCYSAPAPAGLADQPLRPAEASWVMLRGAPMALLRYEDVRASSDPRSAVMAFLQSSYEAGANLGAWDRGALDRP
ncbi:MAG: DUF5996 family protein [Fimbriimonadales bacterium]